MTKIVFLMAQNDSGGHTRFSVNLIGELQKSKIDCTMYVPVFSHFYYTWNILQGGKTFIKRIRFFAGHLFRSRFFLNSKVVAQSMIGADVIKFKRYFLTPKKRFLTKFDFVLTSAHWHVNELEHIGFRKRDRIIHILHHNHTDKTDDIETYFKDGSIRVFASSLATQIASEKLGIRITDTISLGVRVDSLFTDSFPRGWENELLNNGFFTVTFFYYSHARKNPELIERVILDLLAENNINVVLIGHGFENFRYHERLYLRKNLSDNDYYQQISSSDLFVYISRLEGFGLPPLEAMALGVPTLASCVGAIPEYGVDEKNLLLIPINARSEEIVSKILSCLGDGDKLKMLSAEGLLTAKNYSIAKTADLYLRHISL